MRKRKNNGYTLIELMVAVSLIGIVIGMLYLYNNRGWRLFNKSLSFGRLQTDARSNLGQMARNIKLSSHDLIYTNTTFNSNVPLPEDAIYGKPYIYFALAQNQNFEAQELHSRNSTITVPNYDYYLYYIAKAKDRNGDYTQGKAKLKLLIIHDVDGLFTIENSRDWPLVPPELLGVPDITDVNGVTIGGAVSQIQRQDQSKEFSLYQSEFAYNYFNSNYEKLFKIRIKMYDDITNTKVEFETAVTPRN